MKKLIYILPLLFIAQISFGQQTGTLKTLKVQGSGGGGGSVDTTSLSNRINLKLAIADTTGKWLGAGTVIPAQVNIIEGTNITVTGTYPNITISSTGGGSTDTTSLSDRIDSKQDTSYHTNFYAESPLSVRDTMTIEGEDSIPGVIISSISGSGSNDPDSLGGKSADDYALKGTTLSSYGITDAYPLSGNPSGFLTSTLAGSTYVTISKHSADSGTLASAINLKQNALNISQNYLVRNTASGFLNSTIQDNGTGIGIGVAPSVYSNLTIKPLIFTVANKNKTTVFIGDSSGNYQIGVQDSVWNGSSWIVSISTGYGRGVLGNNMGVNASVFGFQGGLNNTGSFISGIGHQVVEFNSGAYVSANGYQSAKSNTGSFVTSNGALSALNNTGTNVNAHGYFSLGNNTADNSNGYGNFSLLNNSGKGANSFGHTNMEFNTGQYPISIGDGGMLNNTGDSVIGIGTNVMMNNNSKNRIGIGSVNSGNSITPGGVVKNFTSANVSGTTITITAHGFGTTGTKVNLRYDSLSGTSVGGLHTGTIYQFTIASANTLTLSAITGAGSGTYSLTKDVDKSNSIFIGNNIVNSKANQTIIGSLGTTEIKLNGAAVIDSFQNKRLVIIGDSYSTLEKWPAFMNDSMPSLSKYNKVDFAIPGQYTDSMVYYYPTTAHLARPHTGDDFWLFTYGGINDINNSRSADSTYAHLKWLWAHGRADGYKVVAFTIIKSLHLTTTTEAERVKLNSYILSDPSLYDYVIDEANVFNPSIDATVFVDSTHLNDAGWKIFAGTIARTINYVPYVLTTTQPISTTFPVSHTPTSFKLSIKDSIDGSQIKGVIPVTHLAQSSIHVGPGLATNATSDSIFLKEKVYQIAAAGFIDINLDTLTAYRITGLASNITVDAPTGATPDDLRSFKILIHDDGTSHAITWNSYWNGTTTNTLPTASVVGKTLYLDFRYDIISDKMILVNIQQF